MNIQGFGHWHLAVAIFFGAIFMIKMIRWRKLGLTQHILGTNLAYGTSGKRGTDVSSGHKLAAVVVSIFVGVGVERL